MAGSLARIQQREHEIARLRDALGLDINYGDLARYDTETRMILILRKVADAVEEMVAARQAPARGKK